LSPRRNFNYFGYDFVSLSYLVFTVKTVTK
jgi:hypothetical protein